MDPATPGRARPVPDLAAARSLLLLEVEGEDDLVPPIVQGVPFPSTSADAFSHLAHEPHMARFYRRNGNPTQARLERLIAALEGAEDCLATASGMGAMSTTLLALVRHGDHVVAQTSMYGGTLSLLAELSDRFGVDVTFVPQADVARFEEALRPTTRLVVLETPSNPLLQLSDISAIASLARSRGALTLVDNTVATPVGQSPLALGADLVLHSLTKSMSGHSDVLGGAVAGSKELIDRIWATHMKVGAVIAPLDSWLTLRGLRTLMLRVDHQNQLAGAVARFLEQHPRVAAVNYPGLESHPQRELAARQMHGGGGLLSFVVAGGTAAAEFVLSSFRRIVRSPSLGGFRSLAVAPAALWARSITEAEQLRAGLTPGLIRLAVGLESPAEVIEDLEQALARLEPEPRGATR